MSKRRDGAAREAARRARRPSAPLEDPMVRAWRAQNPGQELPAALEARAAVTLRRDAPAGQLELVRQELDELEARRRQLLERRDGLVLELRAGGRSWLSIAELAGVSHAALIKRAATRVAV